MGDTYGAEALKPIEVKPEIVVSEDFDKWGSLLGERGQNTRINFNIWRSICDDAVTRYEDMTESLKHQGIVLETVDLDISRLAESSVDFIKPDRVTAGHDIATVIEHSVPDIVGKRDWKDLRDSLVHLQDTFDGSIEIVQSDHYDEKFSHRLIKLLPYVSTYQADLSKHANNLWAIRAFGATASFFVAAAELEVALKELSDEISRHNEEGLPDAPPVPSFLKDKDFIRFKKKYREEIEEAAD